MRMGRKFLVLSLLAPLWGCGGAQSVASADMAPASPMGATPVAESAPPADESRNEGKPDFQDDALAAGFRGPVATAGDTFSKKAPEPPPPPKQAPGGPTTAPAPNGGGSTGKGGESARATDDRRSPILIYRAEFTMSVYEVQKSIDSVEELAKKSGGYLAKRDDRSITIRVPAGEFQAAVAEISKLGDVSSRNVSAEDVTGEYRDLEVQLANALALRERYAKLLDKAQKVEEALAIEQELGRITGEIERIKGRLKLLGELAQYSTITVRFAPRIDQQVQQGPFVLPLPWLNNLGLPRLLQLR